MIGYRTGKTHGHIIRDDQGTSHQHQGPSSKAGVKMDTGTCADADVRSLGIADHILFGAVNATLTLATACTDSTSQGRWNWIK